MRSRQLEASLTEFFGAASAYLRAELASGAEVPFELGAQSARRGAAGTPLYTYRALTGQFIGERDAALKRLDGHAEATKLLEHFDGLDRYLASAGGEAARAKGRTRVRAAIKVLLDDVFDEQSDFELRPERVQAALERLQHATLAGAGEVSLVATLHGVTLGSAELQLTKGLRIAQCDALREVPEEAALAAREGEQSHLIVAYTTELGDVDEALRDGRDVMCDLLSALRLFGDGRVTLGALAWARIGGGAWSPIALGAGGRPHGMLVVTTDQEDELRAFCNLVSRRAPHDNDLAWALRRYELGCERASPFEALTDNLLALRALLEPEGPASGQLAGRLAALCATPEQRAELTERTTRAIALERSLIAGTARKDAAARILADDVANHLRSLLRDVICGHLDPDLAVIADEMLEPDELLHADEQVESAPQPQFVPAGAVPAAEEYIEEQPDDEPLEDDEPEFGERERLTAGAEMAGAEVPEAGEEIVAAQRQQALPLQTDGVAEVDAVAPLG
ncbi:MAG TPA: hypothetical protein VHT25_03615 [Solirubrobacteraceae bacterium]|jgi:hypothetical protein|nr:hypothetical protein [Solirubrobacteraceae bacterium]